jgi:aminopeptidase N
MHAYATDTNFMFKNAVTEDFVAKVNEVAGEDLNWFFDEWVYQPNHPVYDNTYVIDYPGNGTWVVTLSIEQIQTNTVFFRMPVEVKILFKDGGDTLVRVMNDLNPQVFQWTFLREPQSVVFDPNRNILLKQATILVGIKGNEKSDTGFDIHQNEPNPFKDKTFIQYTIPERYHVRISVMDNSGKLLNVPVSLSQPAGTYKVELNSDSLSPGIYYYKMEAGTFSGTRKMIITE